MKRFSEEHQWVEYDGQQATVGITAYAAEELGEITFVELPDLGVVVSQGEALCVVESTKAASDVFAPVGGTVVAVNELLEKTPALVNDAPETRAWICRLEEVDEVDLEILMTEARYDSLLGDDGGG
ncbi:MAG: glycine cleavage system protein GcvH [Victivallales bacterium]|jgi:glycine cleavage system H protein|nr:glycine cleavage system protein GcvH [Victivallales bacterium]MBT7303991.1 glycine cleavage system protein GcvH [Victivallales bacterium]